MRQRVISWLPVGAYFSLIACSQAPPPQPTTLPTPVVVTLEALEADSIAEEIIESLLESEGSLIEPDSLFAPGVVVLADGELRGSVPRLAGVGLGGSIQLVSSRVSASGAFAWAMIEYRWLPLFEQDRIRLGVASMIIGRIRDGSWRLMHMHSSSARTAEPSAEAEEAVGQSATPDSLLPESSRPGS